MAAMLVLGALGGLLLMHRHRMARVREEACRSQFLSSKDSTAKGGKRDEPRCTFEPFGPEYDGGLIVAVMPFVVTFVFLKFVVFRGTKNKPRVDDSHEGPKTSTWVEPRKEPEDASPDHVAVLHPGKGRDGDERFPANGLSQTGGSLPIDTDVEGWHWDDDDGRDLREVVDMGSSPLTAIGVMAPLQDLSPLDDSPRDVGSPSTSVSDGAASIFPSPEKLAHQPYSSSSVSTSHHPHPLDVTHLAKMGSLQRGPLSALSLPDLVPEDQPEFAGFAPPPLPWADAEHGGDLSLSWDSTNGHVGNIVPPFCPSSLEPLPPLPADMQCFPHLLAQPHAEAMHLEVLPVLPPATYSRATFPKAQAPHPVTPLGPIPSSYPIVPYSKSQQNYGGKVTMGEELLEGEMGGVDNECLDNWIAALGKMDSPKQKRQQQQSGPQEQEQEQQWSTGAGGGLDGDGQWQVKAGSGRAPLGASNSTSSGTVLDRRKLHRALALLAARQASGEALFVQGWGRDPGMAEDSDSEGDAGNVHGQDADLAALAPGTDKGAVEDDDNSDPESVVSEVDEREVREAGDVADASVEDDASARKLHVSPVLWGLQGPQDAFPPDSSLSGEARLERGRNDDSLDETSMLSSPACLAPSTSMGSLRMSKQPDDGGTFRFIIPGPLSGLLRDAQLSLLDEDDTSWDWGASDAFSPHPPPPLAVQSLDWEGDDVNQVHTDELPSATHPTVVHLSAQHESVPVCNWSGESDVTAANSTTGVGVVLKTSSRVTASIELRAKEEGGLGPYGTVVAAAHGDGEGGDVTGRRREVGAALADARAAGAGGEDHPRSSRRYTRHLARGIRRLLKRSASMGAVNRSSSTSLSGTGTGTGTGSGWTRKESQVSTRSQPRRRSFGFEGNGGLWMRGAPGSGAGKAEPVGSWSPASLAVEKTNGHFNSSDHRERSSLLSGRYADWQDKECVGELPEGMVANCQMEVDQAVFTRTGVEVSELRGQARAVLDAWEQDVSEQVGMTITRPRSEDSADDLHRFSTVREEGLSEEEVKSLGLGRVRREEAKSLMDEDEEDPKLTAEMRSILIRAKLAANKVTALHAQIMQLSTSPLQSRPESPTRVCA